MEHASHYMTTTMMMMVMMMRPVCGRPKLLRRSRQCVVRTLQFTEPAAISASQTSPLGPDPKPYNPCSFCGQRTNLRFYRLSSLGNVNFIWVACFITPWWIIQRVAVDSSIKLWLRIRRFVTYQSTSLHLKLHLFLNTRDTFMHKN